MCSHDHTELRSQEQGMTLPMGHPWTEWPQRRQLPEPCNHIPNHNTPSGHLCDKEVSKALVIHLKKSFPCVRPLSAKQLRSFNLRGTSLKLLQAFLPQHKVLRCNEGKNQCGRLWLRKDQTRRNPRKKRLLILQSLVCIHTCRLAPRCQSDKQEGLLKWSVSLLPTMAVQLGHSSIQGRAEAWTGHRLATSRIAIRGILLVSCHCYPWGCQIWSPWEGARMVLLATEWCSRHSARFKSLQSVTVSFDTYPPQVGLPISF